MAKHSGKDIDALPPSGSESPLGAFRASFPNFCEIHYRLMMLDPDLTEAELALVCETAADWGAANNCRTEAGATDLGFVVRVWHYYQDPTFFYGLLHDAFRKNAFSKIQKGFVAE
jgi:hypothetical protein